MRIPAISRAKNRTTISKTFSVAAPLGGWNARDALGKMPVTDAVTLTNIWPGVSSCIVRKGYTQYCTGLPSQVESLMVYASGTTSKMFAASGTSIYQAVSGAVGAAQVTALTNARWQECNITTAGGSYMLAVNGADKQRVYDGTAWHKDGDGAPYDVTGVNTANCITVLAFKNRIWLVEKDTLKAWYLPVNSIGGAANSLDMSSVAQLGGSIKCAGTWTIDAGYGVDDMLVFVTSMGEVLVWRLTDPTTPSGIALVGVFNVGAPVGNRCMMKYAGDLLVITQDGVVPLSGALQSSRVNPRVAITDKIQFATSTAISNYGSNFGWELEYFPKENQLYLNVPVSAGSIQQQYVMNTITKSWCNFTGISANCWALFNDDLYFGSSTYVGKGWDTYADNGSNINATCMHSFQSYGGVGMRQCNLIRPHFFSNGNPTIAAGVNVDYDTTAHNTSITFSPITESLWGSAIWGTALWGSSSVPITAWQGVNAVGYTFAPCISTASNGLSLEYVSSDMSFTAGGTV